MERKCIQKDKKKIGDEWKKVNIQNETIEFEFSSDDTTENIEEEWFRYCCCRNCYGKDWCVYVIFPLNCTDRDAYYDRECHQYCDEWADISGCSKGISAEEIHKRDVSKGGYDDGWNDAVNESNEETFKMMVNCERMLEGMKDSYLENDEEFPTEYLESCLDKLEDRYWGEVFQPRR